MDETRTPRGSIQRHVSYSSSPPPPPHPHRVSPLTTSRKSISLMAENRHEPRSFSNVINDGTRCRRSTTRGSSSAAEEEDGIDTEIVELQQQSSFSGMPMFPLEDFDDNILMDHDPHSDHHEEESECSSLPRMTIFLQPRVPIHGCQIPPIAPPSFRRRQQGESLQDHYSSPRQQNTAMILQSREVPNSTDLGLLPMVLSSEEDGDDADEYHSFSSLFIRTRKLGLRMDTGS